jgi:hypothetical protein
LSRDPIEELAFRSRYAQSLSPKERGALYRRRPSINESLFVDNNPVNIVDPHGLTRWCGSCDMVSINLTVGWANITCYLTSSCGVPDSCHYEWVRVSANFFYVSLSLPVGVTRFSACFKSADGTDHSVFSGDAAFAGTSGSVFGGLTIGKINFGGATSEGWVGTETGFDATAAGWGWAPWGTNVEWERRKCD